MVLHAVIAVNGGIPIRALVDTGASHTNINTSFLDSQLSNKDIAQKCQDNYLILANGTHSMSPSKCVLLLHIQACPHKLFAQSVDLGFLCPIVSTVNLETDLHPQDQLYFVQITERNVYHIIPLKYNELPPLCKSFRLSKPELAELHEHTADLLKKGYIQPSNSPYGHPVLFIKKQTGVLRMCVAYRSLNKDTVKNRYPLPRIDDMFDQSQGAKVLSSTDLQSAYYQVRLKPEDVRRTAFTTPMGLYEFRVLCFGLTNAPGTFQNVMNDVLKDVLGEFVLVYVDDIVIFSKDKAEHYKQGFVHSASAGLT